MIPGWSMHGLIWRCFWFWRSWSAPPMSLDHPSRLRSPPFAFCLPATVLLSGARAGWIAAIQSGYPPVNLTVDETRIRVPMHKGINLQLCLVESMRRRFHHVAIYDLPYPRVQTHLRKIKRMSWVKFSDIYRQFVFFTYIRISCKIASFSIF